MLANNGYVIIITLLIALIGSIMPLPMSVDVFRPDWVLLALCYWCLALPTKTNVVTAWLFGLVLDVLLGSTIGIHAASLAICVYIIAANYQKIRNFSVWQQALTIGLVTALHHLLLFWLKRLLSDVVFLPSYLYPTISSVVLWPWVYFILRKVRRRFKVN